MTKEESTEAARGVPLVCAECGAVSPPDAAGWRAYRIDLDEVAPFCPECAEREFGDAH